MKTRGYLSLAVLFLLAGSPLVAQRPGGGGGGQHGQQGQRTAQRSGQGSGPAGGQGAISQTRQMQRDRLRTQATTQQRDQLRTCRQGMEQMRTRTRDMARSASGKGFSADEARTRTAQIQNEFQTMDQTRVQLRQSLNTEQQTAAQPRDQKLDQLRDRIRTRLQTIDAELAKPDPNRKEVSKQARLSEREMTLYQAQLRQMGDDLGMTD